VSCIRIRRGRYVLDYRDQWGKRTWLSFPLTDDGKAAAEREKERIDLGGTPGINPRITLGEYITEHWLPVVRQRVDALTARSYELNAHVHIPQAVKRAPVVEVSRAQLKRFLATLGKDHHLAESTVAKVANVVRSIFESAVDDELIPGNPASGLRLSLGLVQHKAEEVRAMDAGQLDLFLSVARVEAPRHLLELATLAYTGTRIGEMRGLQLTDLDFEERAILVERQVHDDGRVGPVKGRRGKRRPRIVDMSDALREMLVPAISARRQYAMRTGSRGPWLLYPDWPAPAKRDEVEYVEASVSTVVHRLRRAMGAVLAKAKLPPHFTPHCLRHTYARVLLERGEALLYVSRQLGHASLAITADRYGHWARVKPSAGGANLLTGKA
jgi:integrase